MSSVFREKFSEYPIITTKVLSSHLFRCQTKIINLIYLKEVFERKAAPVGGLEESSTGIIQHRRKPRRGRVAFVTSPFAFFVN